MLRASSARGQTIQSVGLFSQDQLLNDVVLWVGVFQEVAWLDAYHGDVYSRISSRLAAKEKKAPFCPPLPKAVSVTSEEVLAWLRRNTKPLEQLLQQEFP